MSKVKYLRELIRKTLFFLFLLFFPLQLGKHFWLPDSLVLGRRIDYLSPTLYLQDILLAVLATILIFENKVLRNFKPLKLLKKLNKIITVTVLMAVVLLVTSQDKFLATLALLRWMEVMLLLIIFKILKPSYKQILYPLSISVIFVVFLASAQFLQQSSLNGLFWFLGERTFNPETGGISRMIINGRLLLRPYATLPHPNALAGYLAALLPLFFFPWKKNDQNQVLPKWIKYLCVLFVLLGIFLSFSRVAWLITVFILFIRSISQIRQTELVRRKTALIIIFITILFFLEELVFFRFGSLFFLDTEAVFDRQRLLVNSLQMIKNYPFFGVGLNNFIPQLPRYQSPPYLLQPVHNIFLLVFAETGIVGFFAVVLGLVILIKSALRKKLVAPLLSLFVALFLGLFDHYWLTIYQTRWMLGLLIIICIITLDDSQVTIK